MQRLDATGDRSTKGFNLATRTPFESLYRYVKQAGEYLKINNLTVNLAV